MDNLYKVVHPKVDIRDFVDFKDKDAVVVMFRTLQDAEWYLLKKRFKFDKRNDSYIFTKNNTTSIASIIDMTDGTTIK